MASGEQVVFKHVAAARSELIGRASALFHDEQVVGESRVLRLAAVPLGEQHHRQVLMRTQDDGVVIDMGALRPAAEVEDPRRVDAVVHADVVTDDGVVVDRVSRRADQHEAALVLITVVVLKHRPAAPVVGVVGLAVLGADGSGHLVELDERVVAGKRPDAGGGLVVSRSGRAPCGRRFFRSTRRRCPTA